MLFHAKLERKKNTLTTYVARLNNIILTGTGKYVDVRDKQRVVHLPVKWGHEFQSYKKEKTDTCPI